MLMFKCVEVHIREEYKLEMQVEEGIEELNGDEK